MLKVLELHEHVVRIILAHFGLEVIADDEALEDRRQPLAAPHRRDDDVVPRAPSEHLLGLFAGDLGGQAKAGNGVTDNDARRRLLNEAAFAKRGAGRTWRRRRAGFDRRRRRYVADQDGHVLGLVPPARLGGQIKARVPPAFLEHQMFREAPNLRAPDRIAADEAHRSSDGFAGVRVLKDGKDFECRRQRLNLVAEK